jgi:hypothetical protein
MKGFIAATLMLGTLGSGLASAGWLQDIYYHCVDPCYPERYNAMARQEVNAAFAAQVNNGHVLDQTMWNYHFEAGTDRLTPGGLYQLAILARRRPHPDCKVYLQTAQDLEYTPAAPDALASNRAELDARRVQAILRYLQAQTAARPMPWDVTVHDPSEVGLAAVALQGAIMQRDASFRGVAPPTFGAGGTAPGGGAGTATGGGARTGY